VPDILTSSSAAVDRANALESVAILKARYFRFMDLKQWDLWQDLFTDDAVMDMRGEAEAMSQLGLDVGDASLWLLRSSATLRGAVEAALAGVVTVHHGHMAELEHVNAGEVRGIWAMEDVIRYPPGRPIKGFHGYGHYHETYVNTPRGWKIASLELRRLLVEKV